MLETNILLRVETARRILNGAISRKKRSETGQFLTPAPIASFMASLVRNSCEKISIVDAGAGAGALFASLVTELISRIDKPKSIRVTAYENDSRFVPYLEKTMALCREACAKSHIHLAGIYCVKTLSPARYQGLIVDFLMVMGIDSRMVS